MAIATLDTPTFDNVAYIHCKPDGSPFYVGKGTYKRSTTTKTRNKYYNSVVNKYGSKNILIGKLECSSEKIAFELEKGLIKCLRNMGVQLTNMTDGGDGIKGFFHSEETKNKISQANKIAHAGRKFPKIASEKAAKANKGSKRSLETRLKMSEAAKKRIYDLDTRKKMSEGQKKRQRSQEEIVAERLKNE